MPRAHTILDFWFGELDEAGLPSAEHMDRWFEASPAVDAEIKARFEVDLRRAGAGRIGNWEREARPALALTLLLDQFARNIYRGTPRAFMFDDHALRVARGALERGHDRELRPIERVFQYMPFEHAEDIEAQHESVRLFTRLAEEAPVGQRERFHDFVGFARSHCEVIERFGRFPHRNAVLGRASSDAERAFLAAGGATWGQAGDVAGTR